MRTVFLFFGFLVLGFLGSSVSFLYAAAPTVGTISPASGTTLPNSVKTFTCAYSDTDGWANLKEAYLLISTSSTVLVNAVYLYYDQNANLLYLRNDANTAWLGGFAPGSANTVENSQAKLDCAATSVSGSVNTLSLSLNLSFKQAFSGKTYNTYLKAIDDTNSATALTKKGTYSINNPAVLGTISPSSGSGTQNTVTSFTTTFTDPDGWANIQYGYLLINSSTSGANCFYGYYNQNSNKLYLRNDANTAWLGGFAPGSANLIENSYSKLDCANTSVTGTDTTLSINWAVSFKTPFTGAKNTYLYVRDDANAYVTYTKKGTWTLPNQKPQTGTITPSEGTSQIEEAVTFSTTYTDPDTWLNIQYVYLLINTTSSAFTNCFYGYYNQNSNKLYLRNDANTAWLGGYAPGSANIIENSYSKLDCANTSVTGADNTLSINWAVSFKTPFTGTKNTYLYVRDDANAYKAWTQAGSWRINNSPVIDSVTPLDGSVNSDEQVIFTTQFSDSDGYQDIGWVFIEILSSRMLSVNNSFVGYYSRVDNEFYLLNDENTGWLGGFSPGSANILENSQVKIYCAQSRVLGLGNTLTIEWAVSFKSTYTGLKDIWLFVGDNNSEDRWLSIGSFYVYRPPVPPLE